MPMLMGSTKPEKLAVTNAPDARHELFHVVPGELNPTSCRERFSDRPNYLIIDGAATPAVKGGSGGTTIYGARSMPRTWQARSAWGISLPCRTGSHQCGIVCKGSRAGV